MMSTWRKWVALSAVVVSGATACGTATTDPVVVDAGVTLAGLNFKFAGATLTTAAGSLPAPDASFAAPVVNISQPPTISTPVTLSVGAAEPFQTVLIQPVGSASYVRIFLPAQTTLISISVLSDATSSFLATSAIISVGNGVRVSKPSTLSLQPISN